MAARPSLSYDAVGDILYIEWCPPYGEQRSIMTESGVVFRYNPATDALERIEVMSLGHWPVDELRTLPVDDETGDLLVALSTWSRAA